MKLISLLLLLSLVSCQFLGIKFIEDRTISNLPEPATVREINSILAGVNGTIDKKNYTSKDGLQVYEFKINDGKKKYLIQYLLNAKTDIVNLGYTEVNGKAESRFGFLLEVGLKKTCGIF